MNISELIPHQGGMCLLERVVAFDDVRVRCATTTHRSTTNPLCRDGRLSAVHLCEYGAQAIAVHGGLLARRAGAAAKPGLLVSLRGVSFALAYVDQLAGELEVEAERLVESETSWQYAFRITHAGELVCEGRAAVMMA